MIYFDWNASTPVRPEARDAMNEALAGTGAKSYTAGDATKGAEEAAKFKKTG